MKEELVAARKSCVYLPQFASVECIDNFMPNRALVTIPAQTFLIRL